jgi:exopolysaccharide biosynthesis WecB/TagA/CpsF family protein
MDVSRRTVNSDRPPWPRMYVGDVAVDLVDRQFAISLIFDSLSASDPLAVESANLHHLHLFAADTSLAARSAAVPACGTTRRLRWLTLLDGVPLVRRANALTGRSWPKLSGSDLVEPILECAATGAVRMGFLGGTEVTHERLREAMAIRFPDLHIVGTWAPQRWQLSEPAECERIAAEIRAKDVDIVVVGLGKPRQERWIAEYGVATGAHVLLAFGATVDFLAGTVRRVPQWAGAAGAEWAWRLMLEPRRLGRRYLIEGPPAYVQLRRRAWVDELIPAGRSQRAEQVSG